MLYQLRVWHGSGVRVWDVESTEAGWKLWANIVKSDPWFQKTARTATVCLATADL